MLKQKDLSIVIPSLGGTGLSKTLNYIHKNKIIPLETIICIPKVYKKKLLLPKSINPKIIYTNVKGQVHQRLIGFKNAKGKYVLQLDDDILINYKSLSKLLKKIKNNEKISISPLLVDKKIKYSNFDVKPKNLFFKFYHYLLNGSEGFRPGAISKAGIPYMFEKKKNLHEVEWLPGGCILHSKKNLIKKNYFNFKYKKAYCEDLIHSYFLKKKNIKLFVDTSSKCLFNSFEGFKSISFWNSLGIIFEDFKFRYYFVRLAKKNIFRMIFFYLLLFLRLNFALFKKI